MHFPSSIPQYLKVLQCIELWAKIPPQYMDIAQVLFIAIYWSEWFITLSYDGKNPVPFLRTFAHHITSTGTMGYWKCIEAFFHRLIARTSGPGWVSFNMLKWIKSLNILCGVIEYVQTLDAQWTWKGHWAWLCTLTEIKLNEPGNSTFMGLQRKCLVKSAKHRQRGNYLNTYNAWFPLSIYRECIYVHICVFKDVQ